MEHFIVLLQIKPGHEQDVADYYRALESDLKDAPGFRGRKIYLAERGRMASELMTVYTREDLAKDPEPPHEDDGTQLVVIEQWDTSKQRLEFSKKVSGKRKTGIIPYLLPEHSHEFYTDLSVD